MSHGTRSLARSLLAGLAALVSLVAAPPAARALDYLAYELQTDRTPPAVCLSFDRPLPRLRQAELAPFVEIAPAGDYGLSTRGPRLCASGLRHGERYRVTLRRGLPATGGDVLGRDVTVELLVPDRAPSLAFAGRGTLLPLRPGTGLPLRSVNLERARIALYRVGERNLLPLFDQGLFGEALDAWSEERLAENLGEPAFTGTVAIARRPNQDVTTLLPLESLAPELRPGLWIAVATPEGTAPEPWQSRATQWFTISDLALTAVRGADGLTLLTRSLETAEPLAGVRVELLARNNEPLASVTSDERGLARIPTARLRGKGGAAPRLLLARKGEGDLAFLRLDEPPLDLVELGIEGRTPPGPLDAFLWTERGVYRPGETVHLGVLLRDAEARAVSDLPLGLVLARPDGLEVDRLVVPPDPLGAGLRSFPIAPDAYSGVWTVTARVGADGPPVGSTSFVVEDFVPPRLELAIEPQQPFPDPAEPIPLSLTGRWLYGAPAAGLVGEVELLVRPAETPFPDLRGFAFGLAEESFLPQGTPPVDFETDEKGRASVAIGLESPPQTSKLLEALVRARLFDLDGRPVTAETVVPLAGPSRAIGLRAAFPGALAEGAEARFEAVLVDARGRVGGPARLGWELFFEERDWIWFQRGGRFEYEEVVRDRAVTSGELAIPAEGRLAFDLPGQPAGRYRLELFDPESGAATSIRFGVGWWAASEGSDRPEKLAISAEPADTPGRARVRIEPAFDARVTLFAADSAVRAVHELAVPKGGASVELEVGSIGPGGLHLLASAVSATGAVLPRLPVRAVGVAWLPGPQAERRLDLLLDAPETIRPSTVLEVTARLTSPPADEPVRLVLMMVDDAVLGLTRFEPPDPAGHYLGRRALGVELRDPYGRLIDPVGEIGRVASGGDRRAALQLQGIDVRTFKTVAVVTGPLEPGPDGVVRARFEVPDFTGRLRLMAVAWSRTRVGSAATTVRVRPPLLAELALPRFLAPGDQADIRLDLALGEAAPGTYEARLSTEGPLAFDRTLLTFRDVTAERRRFAILKLTAGPSLGTGRIGLELRGPDGFRLERRFELAIRPPQAWSTRRELVALEPGRTLELGPALAADLLPGTARLGLSLSTVPSFDVPGLLAELERYPYGCAEQVVSRALPFLYTTRLGPVPGVADPREPAQRAIGRLAALEGAAGGFAAWSHAAERETWLTAYVLDFLQEARAAQVPVPDGLVARTRAWLTARLADLADGPIDLAAGAYGAWVLAREGAIDPSRLRYLALRAEPDLPSDAARIQLAAALASLGERELSARLVAGLGQGRKERPDRWLADYGSPLRDDALVIAVAGSTRLLEPRELVPIAERAARRAAAERWLSTQEQAWLVRAAATLRSEGALEATLDGERLAGPGPLSRSLELAPSSRPRALRNSGSAPLYAAIGVTGIPAAPGPAESRGYELTRTILTPEGKPADLAKIRQSQQLVVLLEGRAVEPGFRRTLLVDLLPAGLELEPVRLVGGTQLDRFAWLGPLNEPVFTGLRDDRFVAALDLYPHDPAFRVAYLVRAVTPGSFVLPGAQVEDMYAPAQFARTAPGRVVIAGR